MKNARNVAKCVVLFLMVSYFSTTSAQEIWRKVYPFQYELTFYASVASSYDDAKQICDSITAEIVQLDNEYVRKAVYFTIGSSTLDRFWIGAIRSSTDINEWKWESGSAVNTSTVKWYNDNTNLSSNNTIIRSSDNKLVAKQKTYPNSGIICQSDKDLSYPWKVDTAAYHVTFHNEIVNSWVEAVSNCSDINATLVQLDDADVKELVYGIISSVQGVELFWIGITKTCKKCTDWVWADGTAASSLDWGSGEPNNKGGVEDKAVIRNTDMQLYDTHTTLSIAAVICQAKRIFCSTASVCENGGTCSEDTPGISSCKCTAGYYGATCSERFCEAHINPCKNNGACSSTNNHPFYKCTCAPNGYYGTTCTADYCVRNPNPCKNGKTCSYKSTSPFYTCNCAANGYYGNTCEDKYCEAHTNPCQNSGTCSSTTSNPFYSCTCASGYYGTTCADKFCKANLNWCRNGATCSSSTKYPFYSCSCAPEYYGWRCGLTFCKYHTSKCKNGGTCSSTFDKPFYSCKCASGYYGTTCSDGYCQAHSNPCQNSGTCTSTTTNTFYSCSCGPRYYGNTCSKTYCSYHANPCSNGGKCISNILVAPYYKCDCTGTSYCGHSCNTTHLVAVENAKVEKNTASCEVNWNLPNALDDRVTGYEILIMENLIYQSPEPDSQLTILHTVDIENQNMSYTLNTKFNRNYSFNIATKTCSGKGEAIVVNGTCATKKSAPYIVPAPTLSEFFASGPTREIIVYLPDMSNGPVSCSFVIVKYGKQTEDTGSFSTQQLQKAADAAIKDNTDLEYLAIAIPSENIVEGKYVTKLGDGNSSLCDVSNIFTGTKLQKRNIESSIYYVGRNKPLRIEGEVYGFYIVTTTPAEDGQVLFQKSKVQYFTNGEIAQQSSPPTVWFAGFIVGLVFSVAATIFGVVFFVKYKKLRKQGQKQQKSSKAIEDAYELDIPRPNDNSKTLRMDLPNGQSLYETISDPSYENL